MLIRPYLQSATRVSWTYASFHSIIPLAYKGIISSNGMRVIPSSSTWLRETD